MVREERRRRQLLRLMAARLALSVALLAVALTVVGVRESAEASERGLYGTMAAAFLATALYALVFRSVTRVGRFAGFQVLTDIVLVTSLVYFSGGKDSIFTFLQIPLIVYAAQLFGRTGAFRCAVAASLAYGSVLLGVEEGWLPTVSNGPVVNTAWFTLWGLHSGAWLLVALLAGSLTRELDSTGAELDRRRSDLESLRRLHARTVESLTSGLLTVEPSGRVTSFNPEAERITGMFARDALGLDLEEVLPEIRSQVIGVKRRASARMRARMLFRRANGRELHLGVAVSVLRDGTGCPDGLVVIFQDVSEVVHMEGDLRRSERLAAVGELAAGMAHEVRNPLAAISGSIQMLRAGLGSDEAEGEGARLMEIVVRETDRLDALIREFLGFARPSPPKLGSVEIEPLLRDLVRMFRAGVAADVKVDLQLAAGLHVNADADQLHQLIWNLLLNAAQAMPGGGTISVVARSVERAPQECPAGGRNSRQGDSWVEMSVEDAGAGIPKDVLERIFEPFFTTRSTGTGLGLATVHRIVEAHGGKLSVESRPREGTRFRIMLPAAREAE